MSTPSRGCPRRRAAHRFLCFGRCVGFVLLDRVRGVSIHRTLLGIVSGRRCSSVFHAERADEASGEKLPIARGREQLQAALRLTDCEARACFDAKAFLHFGIAERADSDRDFGRAVLHFWGACFEGRPRGRGEKNPRPRGLMPYEETTESKSP